MRQQSIEQKLKSLCKSGRKSVAWLIDPDKVKDFFQLEDHIRMAIRNDIGFFFIGGSLLTKNTLEEIIHLIKGLTSDIPVVIFPGNIIQFSALADGILFLSLISGRNPEYLIGQHVAIAPMLAESSLEVLPTGYLLIDGGTLTSVNYISQTIPLPNSKPALAVATAMAGFFLGLQYFYLDAGSGAKKPVNPSIIRAVKNNIQAPLIVGGGLNNLQKVKSAYQAGADLVVIGNGAEKNPGFLTEVLEYAKLSNLSLNVN